MAGVGGCAEVRVHWNCERSVENTGGPGDRRVIQDDAKLLHPLYWPDLIVLWKTVTLRFLNYSTSVDKV